MARLISYKVKDDSEYSTFTEKHAEPSSKKGWWRCCAFCCGCCGSDSESESEEEVELTLVKETKVCLKCKATKGSAGAKLTGVSLFVQTASRHLFFDAGYSNLPTITSGNKKSPTRNRNNASNHRCQSSTTRYNCHFFRLRYTLTFLGTCVQYCSAPLFLSMVKVRVSFISNE